MKELVLFLTLCVSSVWLGPVAPSSKPVFFKDLDSRIINGQNAVPGQFPWQVAIYFLLSGSTYFCGGTLIGTEWILTAGHCVDGASIFQVQLGSNTLQDIDANRVTVVSTTAYAHPNYSEPTIANDIGLIKIPAVTLNTYIQTIPLWSTAVGTNVALTISGFGRTSDASSAISNELKFVTMTTISNAQCALTYGSIIKSNMFCATGTGTKNICGGDSGGPAIVTVSGVAQHIGAASFGSSLGCEIGYPAGFTRSRDYKTWINAVTGLSV